MRARLSGNVPCAKLRKRHGGRPRNGWKRPDAQSPRRLPRLRPGGKSGRLPRRMRRHSARRHVGRMRREEGGVLQGRNRFEFPRKVVILTSRHKGLRSMRVWSRPMRHWSTHNRSATEARRCVWSSESDGLSARRGSSSLSAARTGVPAPTGLQAGSALRRSRRLPCRQR